MLEWADLLSLKKITERRSPSYLTMSKMTVKDPTGVNVTNPGTLKEGLLLNCQNEH